MTVTQLFFVASIGISVFFAISFLILFIYYLIIYSRVNNNFRMVKEHD